MSIENVSERDLRSLVKFATAKFADLASAELKRREKLKTEKLKTETAAAVAAFPKGRWS